MTGCGSCPCSFGTMESYIYSQIAHEMIGVFGRECPDYSGKTVVCSICSSSGDETGYFKWKRVKLCSYCYVRKLSQYTDIIHDYLDKNSMTRCNSCSRKRPKCGNEFHLAYKDRTIKEPTVMCMVRRGDSVKRIKSAIDLSELLCSICYVKTGAAEVCDVSKDGKLM